MKIRFKIISIIFAIAVILSLFCINALADTGSGASEYISIEGDINNDSVVDEGDVTYLLRHTLMPNKYPVSQHTDVNGSDDTDIDDVIYLWNHTLEPEKYPIIGESHIHTLVYTNALEPACNAYGNVEYWTCTVCKNSYLDESCTVKAADADLIIDMIPHTVVTDDAVEPGIGTTGLTEGSHCSVCNQTIVKQETIPALIGVIVNADDGITVSGLERSYSIGDAVSLVATVNEGYIFGGWYKDGEKVSSELAYSFIMPDMAVSLEVVCYKNYNLSIKVSSSDSGTVTAPSVAYETQSVTVTATVNEGYMFGGWYIGGEKVSSDITYTFTMPSADVSMEAVYYKSYNLEVKVNSPEVGTVAAPSVAYETQSVTVFATANEGYTIGGWYIDGTKVSSEPKYTFTMPAEDVSIELIFCKNYSLEVKANSSEFGTVTAPSVAYETQSVTVTAAEKTDYAFLGWFDGDKLVSKDREYTFIMPSSNYALTGRFGSPTEDNINVWDGSVATGFAKGSGTKNDPYLVSTGAELAYLASAINGSSDNAFYDRYYRLTAHIDLNGKEWNPIGCYYYGNGSFSGHRAFSGHFDGNGYTVCNFKISSPRYAFYRYFGLFGYIDGGTVNNLGVNNFTVDLDISGEIYAGGLAGYNFNGTIEKCYATGNISAISGSSACAGGLIGYSKGTISNCYANVTVGASAYHEACAGGFIGLNDEGEISACYATGDISASSSSYNAYAGGFAGDNRGAVSGCYATGNVNICAQNAPYIYAGGFVGNSEDGTITNCYRYEDQVINTNNNVASYNTLGSACTSEQLEKTEFYTSTLGWNARVWDLEDLDLSEGKYPFIIGFVESSNELTVGETYYQLFVNVPPESKSYGAVNLSDVIVRDGYCVKLMATPGEGCEFAGWFIDGTLISNDDILYLVPDGSATVTAKFLMN